MNGQNLTEWRNRMKGKQMTKLQKKYINKMLNTSDNILQSLHPLLTHE